MRRAWSILACLASTALGGEAVAQPSEEAQEPNEAQPTSAAQDPAYRAGLELEAAGDCTGALAQYAEAAPSPPLLLHRGSCQEKLGRWREALASYRLAVAEAERAGDAETAAAAAAALAALEPRVPELTLVLGEGAAGARVFLDGAELATFGSFELDRGRHTVEIFVGDERRGGKVIDLAVGARETVVLELGPRPAPPVAEPASAPIAPPVDEGRPMRLAGLASIALGSVALAGAFAALGLRQAGIADIEDTCGDSDCDAAQDDIDRVSAADAVMIGGFVLATASLAVGISLVVVAGPAPPRLTVAVGPAGLRLGVCFRRPRPLRYARPAEMVSLADVRAFGKYHLVRRVHDYPAPETELGVELLPFDAGAYAAALRRPRALACEVRQLDEVDYRGEAHPIHLVVARPNGGTVEGRPRRRLLVLAGVHGNEHAGTLAIPELLDALGPDDLAGTELRVVTPVNPVGAAEGSRYNGDGFDINRDFLRFETKEARLVREVFEGARPDLLLSLHEGPQAATFLFANRLVPRAMALAMLAAIGESGVELAREDYFHRALDPPGYAPMSRAMWGLSVLWARTLGMMATAMWADGHGVPEITLESSWRCPDAASRVAAHVATIRAALAELGRG